MKIEEQERNNRYTDLHGRFSYRTNPIFSTTTSFCRCKYRQTPSPAAAAFIVLNCALSPGRPRHCQITIALATAFHTSGPGSAYLLGRRRGVDSVLGAKCQISSTGSPSQRRECGGFLSGACVGFASGDIEMLIAGGGWVGGAGEYRCWRFGWFEMRLE